MAYSAKELEKKEKKLGLRRLGNSSLFKVRQKGTGGRTWDFDMTPGATGQMPLYDNDDMCPDKGPFPADRKPWGQLKSASQKKNRAVAYVVWILETEEEEKRKEKRRLRRAATSTATARGNGSGASNGSGDHNEVPPPGMSARHHVTPGNGSPYESGVTSSGASFLPSYLARPADTTTKM